MLWLGHRVPAGTCGAGRAHACVPWDGGGRVLQCVEVVIQGFPGTGSG